MVRWKFWKKRTEAEINKARLLERAKQSLSYGMDFLGKSATWMFVDPDIYPQFLKFLEDAKKYLDQTGDSNFISEIKQNN